MSELEKALQHLRKGRFIMIHDSGDREDETDLIKAAEYAKPEDVARMRTDAGGLICLTIDGPLASRLGLPFLSEIYGLAADFYPILEHLGTYSIKYDKRSAFSVSINHRDTFTGITDKDRALTISEFGKNCKLKPYEFGKLFRTEGHVPVLISSGLGNREGHTELATEMMKMAGTNPAAVICEMLDAKSFKALKADDAKEYAKKNDIAYLEAEEVIEAYRRWRA